MATIYYNIDSGEQPFTASINPAVASDNIHTSMGSFYFTNIPDGEYVITVVDNIGCQAVFDADVYCFTTTTTTAIPTTTTTTILPTTTTTTLVPTTTTTTTECCPVVYNSSLGGFQMAHALINDGTYLYAGERINNATPSSVARIIKYNTNLQEVDSYDVGANKDVESMCYDSVNNRIYATQVGGVGANEVSILIINPVTMNPISETTYSTLITGEGFTIVTDGTYIYGATYAAPPVIFKIRISDMALVSTVTWTGRERAHASRIDTRYGYMYLTDIPYSASTDPYFAKVRLSSLAYTEVNIGAYVRKATDDFAMIDTGSDIYCYIGGEYVYSSGGNAGYGGVQVRVSDLSLTGIAMKTTYAVCEYGDEIYSATIDGNMQIFSRHDLNNVLTCNLSGYYPNELNVLGNRLFGTNFYNYNEADGRVLEFNLCYYFPTTTTTSTTLIPPTTSTTTTLPPTTTTTTTLPPTTTTTTTLPPTTTTTTTLPPTTTTTTTIQETVLVNWSSNIEGNIEFKIYEDGILQETVTTTGSGSFYISNGDTVLVVANIINCSPSISSYTMDITQSGSGTGNGGGCPTFLSSSASLVSNGTTMTIVLDSVVVTTTTTTTAPVFTTTTTTTLAPTTTTTTTTPTPTTTTTTTIPVNFDINYTCGLGTQASITISNFSGGSSSYQTNPSIVFSSEADALNNTNWDEAWDGQTYLAINNGTWWVPLRDANNHSNIIAKFVTFDCSITTTTTTTTLAPTTTTTTAAPWPNENPTEGTFTLPFPSYGGVRVVGRLVYMSDDGLHLFVVASVMYTPAIVVLFRFDLSVPFDLTTISYHSNRLLGGFATGVIPRTLRFNSTGTRVMVMADDHLVDVKDPVIRTFVLSPAWNIVSPTSSYDSVLKHYWTLAERRAMRMSFSESGTTAFMYYRGLHSEYLDFYNLSTSYTIPSGTVSSNGINLFMDFGGITNGISGMRVYNTSLSPAKVEVSINNASSQAQVGLCNINTSTWNANTAWSNQYIFTTFAASDVYSMRGRFLNYILENNAPSSSPLYPRVHCKILLGV